MTRGSQIGWTDKKLPPSFINRKALTQSNHWPEWKRGMIPIFKNQKSVCKCYTIFYVAKKKNISMSNDQALALTIGLWLLLHSLCNICHLESCIFMIYFLLTTTLNAQNGIRNQRVTGLLTTLRVMKNVWFYQNVQYFYPVYSCWPSRFYH